MLAWLLLAAFGLCASAAGGGSGSGSIPPAPTELTPVGEEGNSLPIVRDVHGLTFVGPLRELRALAITLRGRGFIDVSRVGGGLLAVTLVGDYAVELDRAALAGSSVAVLFRGGTAFQGGLAFLQIGSSAPLTLDPERVPLPVGRLAASPRAQGSLLALDVQARGTSAHVTADFLSDRVAMTQRIL
jgi:hypothetical protein